MRRVVFAVALGCGLATGGINGAHAWTPYAVGQPCQGLKGGGATVVHVQGNVLGGRHARGFNTDRDYKSFQRCFRTVEACASWANHLQQRYPLHPAIARCTPMIVR